MDDYTENKSRPIYMFSNLWELINDLLFSKITFTIEK
jgi:hypothetical protein